VIVRHQDPNYRFLPNWHIEIIADELNKCYRGETNRLIITVPPRSLKSHCASVAFPAWLLGRNPCTQIIAASYAQDLAAKHALDCRNVVTSDWFQRLFQTRLSQQRQAIQEFVTTKNGWRLATSVGGVLTGRGSDFIIIDDPLKPDEALSETQRNTVNNWFDHTVYSRLNNKRKGCIILIMQRLHEDDLVGHVQTLEDWRVLNFPAIAEHDEHYTIQTPFGEFLAGQSSRTRRSSFSRTKGCGCASPPRKKQSCRTRRHATRPLRRCSRI
jgi:hypothetical protein